MQTSITGRLFDSLEGKAAEKPAEEAEEPAAEEEAEAEELKKAA